KEIQYAQVLADHFKAMGLKPGNGKSYFQEYEFTNGVEIAKGNVLKINGVALSNDDWVPASYSQLGEVADAPVTFAGYGIVAPANENDPAYDSYQGLDVRGKWVLIFDGLPEDVTQTRRFHLHLYSRLQHKALVARERGAKGLILIGDARLRFEGRGENAGLPLVRASSVLADRLLAKTAMNHQGWTNRLAKGGIAGGDVKDTVIGGDIQLKMLKAKTRNVVAKLEAKGAKDTLVLGAHLDHLGRGESGNSLSQIEGAIHHGADDNASGVAAVMEVAHRLGALQAAGDLELKRNIVFGLWTGEEIGILGSTHFVKESKDKLIGYINMDMVGRMRDQTLIVQGLGSAKEWPKLIADMNAGTDALTVK
ncbi:MAG TPA: M20/M25/M40 family metallo-hydrolase, partial [Bdellovibrionales bacterium]|nr:M20/M25/M40 family metallo-hydrolase [Bdellovibrionales bacterium]